MESAFEVNSLVLAKYSKYKWWPAAIKRILPNDLYRVVFLSDFSEAEVESSRLKRYSKNPRETAHCKGLLAAETVADRILNGVSTLELEMAEYVSRRQLELSARTSRKNRAFITDHSSLKKLSEPASEADSLIEELNLAKKASAPPFLTPTVKRKLTAPKRDLFKGRIGKSVLELVGKMSEKGGEGEANQLLREAGETVLGGFLGQPVSLEPCDCDKKKEAQVDYTPVNNSHNNREMERNQQSNSEEPARGREAKKQTSSSDWAAFDPRVSFRVSKKIGKVIYLSGAKGSFHKVKTKEVGNHLENQIKGSSKNIPDYKQRVMSLLKTIPAHHDFLKQICSKNVLNLEACSYQLLNNSTQTT